MAEQKERKERKEKDVRQRAWATVVYPESAPDDWLQILGEQCVPCFVSPLHDQDENPDGSLKKKHWHVLFTFDGKKSREQIAEITDLIGGVGQEKVKSTRGYARYLCHLDNPEKHQYEPSEVKQFGGADYYSLIGVAVDKYQAIGEMIDFCTENGITEYCDLLEHARKNEFGWFRILCDNGTVVMREYLKSVWFKTQAMNRG